MQKRNVRKCQYVSENSIKLHGEVFYCHRTYHNSEIKLSISRISTYCLLYLERNFRDKRGTTMYRSVSTISTQTSV